MDDKQRNGPETDRHRARARGLKGRQTERVPVFALVAFHLHVSLFVRQGEAGEASCLDVAPEAINVTARLYRPSPSAQLAVSTVHSLLSLGRPVLCYGQLHCAPDSRHAPFTFALRYRGSKNSFLTSRTVQLKVALKKKSIICWHNAS